MHEGKGECVLNETPDILTIGLPCQPFSAARDRTKCPPQSHELYSVTFTTFMEYIKGRKPKGFICEQVIGFNRMNQETGETYMTEFCSLVAEQQYAVRAHQMVAGDWSEAPRNRCLGFDAATENHCLQSMHNY